MACYYIIPRLTIKQDSIITLPHFFSIFNLLKYTVIVHFIIRLQDFHWCFYTLGQIFIYFFHPFMCVCVCVCVCQLHTVRNWEIVPTPFLSPPTHFPPSVGFFLLHLYFVLVGLRVSFFFCNSSNGTNRTQRSTFLTYN